MNKLIAIALTLAGALAGASGLGLIGIWGYAVALVVSVAGIGALFFKKEPVKIVELPQSTVPVERLESKTKKEQLAELKAQRETRDNKAVSRKADRKEEFEKNRKSDPELDAVRAKLKLIRSGQATDEH